MAGVRIFSLAIVFAAALLQGCAGLYERPDEIVGNNTGGVIPQKMAASQNVEALASAHCAKWNSVARITFPASQTGGEVVFVCEKPGQTPPQVPAEKEPPAQKPAPKKKSK